MAADLSGISDAIGPIFAELNSAGGAILVAFVERPIGDRYRHGRPTHRVLKRAPDSSLGPTWAVERRAYQMSEVVDAYLVAGGRYHDFDFARLELLKLLAEHSALRVVVGSDYADTDAISACSFLVTYTCDLRPSEGQQGALAHFVQSGGRWLALHSTNVVFDVGSDGTVASSRVIDPFVRTVGSRFVDHPPIRRFRVERAESDHPLVFGLDAFETDDELYVNEYPDRAGLIPLLTAEFAGDVAGVLGPGLQPGTQLVSYLRPLGDGAVLFNSLGHCRGHYDMRPHVDYYPTVERCSWGLPVYQELLRRGIRWGLRAL